MADLTENLKKLGADDGIMVLNSVRMKSFKHWPFSGKNSSIFKGLGNNIQVDFHTEENS